MSTHLPILPVLLPLLAGALLLLMRESGHGARALLAVLATLAQLGVALLLVAGTPGSPDTPTSAGIRVYALGGWPAPFGIVLVVDRLAGFMLSLTAILGLAAMIYALARWERAGSHFLPLFQFLLMGLNGAFLTGDLFNLFVFFEILLAASYGLALHGSGRMRVRAGLHYIVINLVASLVFLIAAALIYGLTGTLNMAEVAQRMPQLDADLRGLFDLAVFLLGLVFLVKAAAWPLNFWLPATYAAAAAPVGGVFALLTKVGIYGLLRISTLFGQDAAPAPFQGEWLFHFGLITLAVASLGVLSVQKLDRLAGFMILLSSGLLLAAFGFSGTRLTGPGLYYLASSVLGGGALFMLVELAERNRVPGNDFLAVSAEAFGLPDGEESPLAEETAGVAIPAAMAFLGLAFITCAVVLAGLPPFSGFVAKFALLRAALMTPGPQAWLFFAALLLSGLAGLIALSRLGIRVFWDRERPVPRLQLLEAGPVAALLLLCMLLAFGAGPALVWFETAATALHDSGTYIRAVLPTDAGVPP
ncbi:MAG TPA: monovalent cation/H+ antiporter subunit D [Thiobacillaceae bacterium]|nr:monovalent cation/H+ antiporter subunit D [Thiobacillaceae bacterium]HNU64802.1 monovalent cation/H+ antiporter subunit D [Thiobacillaceae bacterium]